MKQVKFIILCLILVISSATAAAADVFSVKTALTVNETRKTADISVVAGEVLEFSPEDLELRLGLKPQSLVGITVASLPRPEQGEIVLEGINVDPFEFISRDKISQLCFVPGEEAVSASLTIIPRADKDSTANLAISVIAAPNIPPELKSASIETESNVAVSGYLGAYDPEGDEMTVRVVQGPKNGTVRFDGLKFGYTPYKDVYGYDSFTVRVIDSAHNFSNEAVVDIQVAQTKYSFRYADMTNNPSAYAAIKLHENGVISGMQVGDRFFFAPDRMTTRGEFLVMLIAAGGFEDSMKPTVNTGLANDVAIPSYLKPYVKKAIEEDIWSSTQQFVYDQIPTRAEAVVLVDRAAKINDVKDFTLSMGDQSSIPYWALPSYKDLAAYRMLDLYDNMARPADALTNSYSADLLWQLWKHTHR